jgi:CRP-like cAMP-binding protein
LAGVPVETITISASLPAPLPRRLPTGRTVTATENLLLAGLPEASLAALRPHLERVTLPLRRVVMEPDQAVAWVYFPETGVFSVTVHLLDGSATEVNLVGREGMAGLAGYLRAGSAPLRVMTLVSGTFLRMPARLLADTAGHDDALSDRLGRYTQAVLSTRAYSAACDRLHPVEARLARWLLKTHDRVRGDEFRLTQDLLALMLGVARPSVTLNAHVLQQRGLIECRRGRIRITDRLGLEASACECYWAVRREFERLLGWRVG